MNRRHFIQALGTISLLRLQAQNVDEGWRPLFDGGTLKGWKATARSPHSKVSGHTTAGHWRVEGAVLVGSQDTPGNGGLILTEEEFGDFEVVLEMNNDVPRRDNRDESGAIDFTIIAGNLERGPVGM